jgi:hypothetical protein
MEVSLPGQTMTRLIRNVVYDYRLFIWGFITGVSTVVATGSLFRRK